MDVFTWKSFQQKDKLICKQKATYNKGDIIILFSLVKRKGLFSVVYCDMMVIYGYIVRNVKFLIIKRSRTF